MRYQELRRLWVPYQTTTHTHTCDLTTQIQPSHSLLRIIQWLFIALRRKANSVHIYCLMSYCFPYVLYTIVKYFYFLSKPWLCLSTDCLLHLLWPFDSSYPTFYISSPTLSSWKLILQVLIHFVTSFEWSSMIIPPPSQDEIRPCSHHFYNTSQQTWAPAAGVSRRFPAFTRDRAMRLPEGMHRTSGHIQVQSKQVREKVLWRPKNRFNWTIPPWKAGVPELLFP